MLDFVLKDEKGKTIDHNYMQFIKMPLLRDITSSLDIYGNAYILMNKMWKKILGLEILSPANITTNKDQNWRVLDYMYTLGSRQYKFPKEEVIDFHNFDPNIMFPYTTEWVGNMQALSQTILLESGANNWNNKFFKNSARPDGVLATDQSVNADEAKRLQDMREQKYQGENNSHKTVVMGNWLKYQSISIAQKDMDFIEQKRFNRDEILAIFNVPKALLGMWEGVNVGNVKAFETIFARRTIKPVATLISERLNETLFSGIGTFVFINIVPIDDQETRADFQSGALTINEFRATRGLPAVKNGDVLKPDPFTTIDATPVEVTPTKEGVSHKAMYEACSKWARMIAKEVRKHEQGTPEFYEEKRVQKIDRNNKYEDAYRKKIKQIAEIQRKDIISQYEESAKSNIIKAGNPKLSLNKYLSLYYSLLKDEQTGLIKMESQQAYEDIWLKWTLDISKPSVSNWMKSNIARFAKDIDAVTNDKIASKMSYIVDNWLSVYEGTQELTSVFEELSTSRADLIVRTETIRAGNYSTLETWKESWVVTGKQWYTAMDERVCDRCGEMDWKIIGLEENYFDKGSTLRVWNNSMKLDYSDVDGAPLHPGCRCTLLPIME